MTIPGYDLSTLDNLPAINQCVFSFGSNLGDRLGYLTHGVRTLADTPDISVTAISSVYVTKPVGKLDQDDFYNLVVIADSHLSPNVLLDRANAIEEAFGRRRGVLNGPRTLDIDIIKVGRQRITTPQLEIPHPRAHERAFVLVPWLEVDPHATLPQGPIIELVRKVDSSGVRRTHEKLDLL